MKNNFKELIIIVIILFITIQCVQSQEKTEGYIFKEIKRLPATSVKDQHRSGTCWSFSTLSFIESEMMRMGKKDIPDLSEMFTVRQCYSDKAERYVRMHSSLNFGGGGAFHDLMYVYKKYGFVPEEVFSGLQIGEKKHIHGEMDDILKSYTDGVIKNSNKKLSPVWHKGFDLLLDTYLGAYPEKFSYKGKEYTPRTFADQLVGINPDDYIELTSYTHHPFYSTFILEVPDNWLWGQLYNLPIDELMQTIDNALNSGYTVAWAADVSEPGFSYTNGIAVVSATIQEDLSNTEQSKWETMDKKAQDEFLNNLKQPGKEKVITQEMRQTDFDNYTTTDDHGMHIVGIANDQKGTKYYIVKNSWDTGNKYQGYFYASEAFVRFKTMDIMIHKDALPKEIRKKLGL
jgi:bleomycin hydrolase